MKALPTCTYDTPDLITSTWVINYRSIDTNTGVLSPSIATNVIVLKLDIVATQLEPNVAIEAANKYVLATIAMVISVIYEAEALMRFIASVS